MRVNKLNKYRVKYYNTKLIKLLFIYSLNDLDKADCGYL